MKKKAIIVMVHGSRVKATADELNNMLSKLNTLSDQSTQYFPAYMEIQSPSLLEAIPSIIDDGYDDIEVLPLFILAGKHVRKDIPEQIEDSQKNFPEIKISLQEHIGLQETFLHSIISLNN